MKSTLRLALFSTLALGGIAHAAPATGKAKKAAATATTPKARVNRAVLKAAVADARIHPNGAKLVADPTYERVELASGAKVLLQYSHWDVGHNHNARFEVPGKIGNADVPVQYLSAKESSEVRAMLAPAVAALPQEGIHFQGFIIDGIPIGTLKVALAGRLAPTSHDARNVLTLAKTGIPGFAPR